MVYLLYGDPFFARLRTQELANGSFAAFDVSAGVGPALLDELRSSGLFGSLTVLIRNFEHMPEKEIAPLLEAATKSGRDTFFYSEDPSKKITALFKKYRSKFVEAKPPRGILLGEFFKNEIKKAGIEATPEAQKLLIMLFKDNPANFIVELGKLAHAGSVITPDIVYSLIRRPPASYFFEVVDRALAGDKKTAAALLRHELEGGVDALSILAMFTSSFRNLLFLKLGKKPKLHPYALRKLSLLKNKFSQTRLKQIFIALSDADFKIKTRENPATVLEDFILGL